jgi:hypothetical protein
MMMMIMMIAYFELEATEGLTREELDPATRYTRAQHANT